MAPYLFGPLDIVSANQSVPLILIGHLALLFGFGLVGAQEPGCSRQPFHSEPIQSFTEAVGRLRF